MSQSLDYSFLNIDFNNFHDVQQLQRIIIELKAIIQNKIKSINELTAVHDREEEEREMILRRMNETKVENLKKIEEYGHLIYTVSQSYSKFNKDSDQQKEKQRKTIETMHQIQMVDISKKIEDLQNQYKKLKEFQDMESDYINKIQALKKQIIGRQYEHNDGMNQLQAMQLKQNKDLEQHLSNQITKTQKTAPSHAVQKITTELQTNEQQNVQLKQKLFHLQGELQKLKKQRNQIVSKRKELKINVTLNEDQLEQYKAVGSLQKVKIKAFKDKLETMKVMISEEVAKKEKTLNDHKKQRQTTIKTLKLKLFNLDKEKEDLRIQMEKINLLAQTILQQRTQIEEFFVMALDSCKQEIEDFEKGKLTKGQQQKGYGQKVDIDELLPKDKQRILTNLYTKLAFGSK